MWDLFSSAKSVQGSIVEPAHGPSFAFTALLDTGLVGDFSSGCPRRIFCLAPWLCSEQWEEIADVIQEKNHVPFFDVAYQGFASGSLDADAASVRLFAARGMELLVAQSYSKNLGLHSADAATRVKSQLKRFARAMYSNPPAHGAKIVATFAGDPALFDEWKAERETIAGRIKNVRRKLYDSLSAKDKSGKDWSFTVEQIGLFSFTGLSEAQGENMTKKWHVHMTKDGRISMAGLSLAKCEYLADAILDSYHNVG